MPKVICKLENASPLINGFKFTPHPDGLGMVSEELAEEHAAHFASIDGYELHDPKKKAPEKAADKSKDAGKGQKPEKTPAPAPAPASSQASAGPAPDGETPPAGAPAAGAASADVEVF